MVEWLLTAGAAVHVRNVDGLTAYEGARLKQLEQVQAAFLNFSRWQCRAYPFSHAIYRFTPTRQLRTLSQSPPRRSPRMEG